MQVCHDMIVDNCHSHDNADLGLHPGSGCQRPLLTNNRSERNGVGLYWCWGVKYGLAENNRFDGNEHGISIGHNDTDNVMRNNDVSNSGKVGILFRDEEGGKDFWANRNVVEKNRITNSGGPDDAAIDIQGETKDLKIVDNTLQETRSPMKRVGIRIDKRAARIELAKNSFEGFANNVLDLRRG
jgi:parallel beta-helix repeat protein